MEAVSPACHACPVRTRFVRADVALFWFPFMFQKAVWPGLIPACDCERCSHDIASRSTALHSAVIHFRLLTTMDPKAAEGNVALEALRIPVVPRKVVSFHAAHCMFPIVTGFRVPHPVHRPRINSHRERRLASGFRSVLGWLTWLRLLHLTNANECSV